MLVAMIAGTMLTASGGVACPPEPSSGDEIRRVVPLIEVGDSLARMRVDEPVQAARGQVKVSEAPNAERFTDASLGKVFVSASETATLKEFAAAIGAGAQLEVFVDWERLDKAGLRPDMKIATPLKRVQLEQAMRIVNERSGAGGRLAVRRTGEMIEVNTQETFDRREQTTVAYDVRGLLEGARDDEARKQKLGEITGAMMGTIDPEGWADNGGDTSRQSFSEGKLFVVAPARVQRMVGWFFSQVTGQPITGAEGPRSAQQVQILRAEPESPNTADAERRRGMEVVMKEMRRGLAEKKAELGAALTFEEREAMDDPRTLRDEVVELRTKLAAMQRQIESLRGPTWREATQGAGDYRSFK